jgi:hypothetical protein
MMPVLKLLDYSGSQAFDPTRLVPYGHTIPAAESGSNPYPASANKADVYLHRLCPIPNP